MAALWDHVEVGGRRAEQRHGEVLQLYTELKQQRLRSAQSSSDGVEPWLNSLLDQQLSDLRKQLDEERQHREQVRRQDGEEKVKIPVLIFFLFLDATAGVTAAPESVISSGPTRAAAADTGGQHTGRLHEYGVFDSAVYRVFI